MLYDPTLYLGAAAYYARGRPPYSRALVETLTTELSLDGSGRLLDVGCGPGALTTLLAGGFEQAVGVDPDTDMLAEGARRAKQQSINNINWARALAEELATLSLGQFRLATFGHSLHWMEQDLVVEMVYDLLEPGGAMAVITHAYDGRQIPPGPNCPRIPHDALRAIISSYLGSEQRAGKGIRPQFCGRFEETFARSRFGTSRTVYCPGRDDIIQDVDGVLANYLSTSFCAPHLFGDLIDAFKADVRSELLIQSPNGLFWDWPGDTEVLIAQKTQS